MASGSELFIVDNSERDWKVARYLRDWCRLSSSIDIATGHFEIGGLLELADEWQKVDRFRILMGDEVTRRTKQAMIEGICQLAARLDQSIEVEKERNDFLTGVPGHASRQARFNSVAEAAEAGGTPAPRVGIPPSVG